MRKRRRMKEEEEDEGLSVCLQYADGGQPGRISGTDAYPTAPIATLM